MPLTNWYKVRLDGAATAVAATVGQTSGFTPMGARPTNMIAPGNTVLVWQPPGRDWAFIIAAYPQPHNDGTLIRPGYVNQGSQAGALRDPAHRDLPKVQLWEGGLRNFNANRPLDQTTLDWGAVTETGLSIHLDPFMAHMRVSELCGLFLNYFDQYTRLAGLNMDIQTPAIELVAREDEGETRLTINVNPYWWESLGLYAAGTNFANEFDDQDVLYNLARGKQDMPQGKEDVQSINRVVTYGGYIGQGKRTTVMIPAATTGIRRYSDNADGKSPDMGVFEEFVGLDGTYGIRSAKQVFISKYCLIPAPKEIKAPESQDTGDDARKNNYKFSGAFGDGGETPNIGDIGVSGDNQHVLQASAIFDILAYNHNWKAVHPFYYHKQDYKLPEESEISNLPRGNGPKRAQDVLAFGDLAASQYMAYPTPQSVKVDDRYGDVDYFQRQAGITLLPDGGVVIYDGYGSTITMSGGCIRFDCPGDVQIMPGRSLIALAGDDAVIRARNSFDITAGQKDGRIKASHNLQLVGGDDSGAPGGILIESKASGFTAQFDNLVGEDVVQGGIILKAGQSSIVNWAGDIYLRTGTTTGGAGGLSQGNIVLDASKGLSSVIMKGQTVQAYAADNLQYYIGPNDTVNTVQTSYIFSQAECVLGGYTIMQTGAAILGGGLIVEDSVQCQNGYGSVNNTPNVNPIKASTFSAAISELDNSVSGLNKQGTQQSASTFTNGLYEQGAEGNDSTIMQAAFSFRDDTGGEQYNVTQFALPESRWQQMVRLQMGTGGNAWAEPTLTYQGRELQPYPGKSKWEDESTLMQLKELTIYDAANGYAKDRGDSADPYVEPELSGWTTVTPAKGFTVIMS